MQTSYARLVDEHAGIDSRIRSLNAAIDERMPSADLAASLHELGYYVRDHLEGEAAIVEACEELRLAPSWAALLTTGKEAFETLCVDWTAFVSGWTEEAIREDCERFAADARTILARLGERVDREARALYATGLQHGVIAMK